MANFNLRVSDSDFTWNLPAAELNVVTYTFHRRLKASFSDYSIQDGNSEQEGKLTRLVFAASEQEALASAGVKRVDVMETPGHCD